MTTLLEGTTKVEAKTWAKDDFDEGAASRNGCTWGEDRKSVPCSHVARFTVFTRDGARWAACDYHFLEHAHYMIDTAEDSSRWLREVRQAGLLDKMS